MADVEGEKFLGERYQAGTTALAQFAELAGRRDAIGGQRLLLNYNTNERLRTALTDCIPRLRLHSFGVLLYCRCVMVFLLVLVARTLITAIVFVASPPTLS